MKKRRNVPWKNLPYISLILFAIKLKNRRLFESVLRNTFHSNRYNRNCSSTCNTPKKILGHTIERTPSLKQVTTATKPSIHAQSFNRTDNGGNKNISRDLFSPSRDSLNESTKSLEMRTSLKLHDQTSLCGEGFDSPMYTDFRGDLKTTLTPIAVHRLNSSGTHPFSTPVKNISILSTSTPSQPNSAINLTNRSGHSQSRYTSSRHHSSNDSKSFSDSSTFDASGSIRSHDKSKDKRNTSTSSICLGDYLTPIPSKQHSQKTRKSLNSTERSPTVVHEKDFPSFTPKGKVNRIALTPVSASMQSHGLVTTYKSNQAVKPTKRVVPTRIGGSNNEFNCPAFRSDNNILELQHEEADSTRDLLKSQKDMIRRVFQEEQPPETNLRALLHESLNHEKKSKVTKTTPPIDLKQITNKLMLDKFIEIYSIVLDLNLVTNILTEIAYLVNLINLDVDEYYERNPHMLDSNSINDRTNAIETNSGQINAVAEPTKCDEHHDGTNKAQCNVALNKANTCAIVDNIHAAILLLKNINNCVYFGLGVLQLQKNILRMLDVTSIKVLLENERLTTLDSTIKDDLMSVYSHKMQLERLLRTHDTLNGSGLVGFNAALLASNGSMRVCYQQEQDTQMYFPSTRESAAFKKQRDHFYSILGTWESKHFNPVWDFEAELGRRIRSMLNEMNHPINMAHMAKLFTAQLILSCNSNEVIQSDLPNIDPEKLNKLRQRLIAPSHFSTNFQFPGNQMFFKDFIIAAENQTTFIEQLKIILTNELIEINDSSYETLNLSSVEENEHGNGHEYIVKPETLSTLSVLAKFLGFIVARPFIYEFGTNTTVDNRQIELRNKIRTMIDIKDILKKCVINHKLIVTLPWIVQFISMLDPVSLRSDYYRDVFDIFYELYTMTSDFESNFKLSMRQTSVFIIRSCLGWLFDQENVPNEYYSYRQNRKQLETTVHLQSSLALSELTSVEILVPKDLLAFFTGKQQVVFNYTDKQNDNTMLGLLQRLNIEQKVLLGELQQHSPDDDKSAEVPTFDPLLEALLQAACPFLADFRVSIMPKRNSKSVSRTGRYRHITPKICEITSTAKTQPTPQLNKDDAQSKLVEAFLHSQSLSVRRTVEFVQERVYSAVVKDFQVEILIPFKKCIADTVDKIQLKDSNAILNELYHIYSNSEKELLAKWQDFVTSAASKRVKIAFDALLPHETVDACKLTCMNIALQQTLTRINEWRSKNLNGIEIFSKDIQADMEKVQKNTLSNQPQMENKFRIDLTKRPPWQTFKELQFKLHQISMYPEQIDNDVVNNICAEIRKCISEHVLPDPMYRTIGVMMVHLLLLLICNRHDVVTMQVIDQFISLWKCKQFASFVRVPTPNDETESTDGTQSNLGDDQLKVKLVDTNYLFSSLFSPMYVFAQQSQVSDSFDKLAQFMTKLIKAGLMNFSFLNEQTMKLMQFEWNQITLRIIARTIQHVIDDCKDVSPIDDREAFFMQMLANLISNLVDIAFDP